jgi:hypothetical protein
MHTKETALKVRAPQAFLYMMLLAINAALKPAEGSGQEIPVHASGNNEHPVHPPVISPASRARRRSRFHSSLIRRRQLYARLRASHAIATAQISG